MNKRITENLAKLEKILRFYNMFPEDNKAEDLIYYSYELDIEESLFYLSTNEHIFNHLLHVDSLHLTCMITIDIYDVDFEEFHNDVLKFSDNCIKEIKLYNRIYPNYCNLIMRKKEELEEYNKETERINKNVRKIIKGEK